VLRILGATQKEIQKFKEIKVSLSELFSPSFMQRYTDSNAIDDFLNNSELFSEDVDKTPQEIFETKEFNEYVKQHTKFNTWSEMFSKAVEEWFTKKLG